MLNTLIYACFFVFIFGGFFGAYAEAIDLATHLGAPHFTTVLFLSMVAGGLVLSLRRKNLEKKSPAPLWVAVICAVLFPIGMTLPLTHFTPRLHIAEANTFAGALYAMTALFYVLSAWLVSLPDRQAE